MRFDKFEDTPKSSPSDASTKSSSESIDLLSSSTSAEILFRLFCDLSVLEALALMPFGKDISMGCVICEIDAFEGPRLTQSQNNLLSSLDQIV